MLLDMNFLRQLEFGTGKTSNTLTHLRTHPIVKHKDNATVIFFFNGKFRQQFGYEIKKSSF